MPSVEIYYRYIDQKIWYDENRYEIEIRELHFPVSRTTPKGVWLNMGYGLKEKFILNDARRRFAYPTQELAMESFKARKRHQRQHILRALRQSEKVYELLKMPIPKVVQLQPDFTFSM